MGTGRVAPWVAIVVALASTCAARAQDPESELGGYVTLSSGYWRHGLSQSDGASLQLGVDYQHHTGFFAYARAMNVEYPQNLPGQARDVEVSSYVGYHDRGDRWSWTVSVGRYVYPDAADYNYDEWSASVGFRDRVFYTASYNDEYYARGSSALNQEVALAFPLPGNFEVGGAVGYFDIAAGAKITHWNVGASKLLGRMAIDLRYYDGDYYYRNYLGDPRAQNYVLSVTSALKWKRAGVRR
ncbi:MAG TPA: TorF family putative porin [Gammaproteobacteria bacterium]|nr:TorF family putative porin [Gammaproteobacteria bacterium]